MTRSIPILGLLAGIAVTPLAAQKNRPPAGLPTAPTTTPAPARPAAPADTTSTGNKGRRPPTLMGAPAGRQDSAVRATNPPPAGAPAGVVAPAPGVVAPQAATPGARRAAGAAAFTAGVGAPVYEGTTLAEALAYSRRAAPLLDSAVITLVEVFRNTSGQPLAGALDPTALSQREKDRWARCRDAYYDLRSYEGLYGAVAQLTRPDADPGLARAAAALDSVLDLSLADTAAIAECDNLSSMIVAPARWSPWDQQYQAAARRFYAGWYPALRNVADRNRAFVIALNAVLPAEQRITVPPALQRNPPYAGAGPR